MSGREFWTGRPTVVDNHHDCRSKRDLVGERILVTGGAGFIGSRVVTHLLACGAIVKVIDNFSRGDPRNLVSALNQGLMDTDIWECDIRSDRAARAITRWCPSLVVHLAAQISVADSVDTPGVDADVNIRGTINLLEAVADAGSRHVIFMASAAIYGNVDHTRLPIREDHPIAPAAPYGLSKAAALGYLVWFSQHHRIGYTALVPGNVYGPDRHGGQSGVIAQFAAALLDDCQPNVVGDGSQTRDFVYVEDVADAVVRACVRTPGGMINIASGTETSVQDVLRVVTEAVGSSIGPRYVAPRYAEPRRVALAVERAHEILGWYPATSLRTGIHHIMGSYADLKKWVG